MRFPRRKVYRLTEQGMERAQAPGHRPGDVRQTVRTEPPRKATKAVVAAVITLAGLVGIHLTHGTAELLVGLVQLAVLVYGVWRTPNAVKPPNASRDPARWYFG